MSANLTMTRGDSQLLAGTITPPIGRTFSVPATELRFTLKVALSDETPFLQKTIGDGVTIEASSTTAISYTVTIDPDDTSDLTAAGSFYYDLELTEADGWVSTPLSGRFYVTLDVST